MGYKQFRYGSVPAQKGGLQVLFDETLGVGTAYLYAALGSSVIVTSRRVNAEVLAMLDGNVADVVRRLAEPESSAVTDTRTKGGECEATQEE